MIDIKIDEETFYPLFFSSFSNFVLHIEDQKYRLDNQVLFDPNPSMSVPTMMPNPNANPNANPNRNPKKIDITKIIGLASLQNTFSFLSTKNEFFNKPEFKDMIQFLVEKIPSFSNYEIITEDTNLGTVEEYLSNKKYTIDNIEYLYHGTSEHYAKQIFENGIKPRSETKVVASFINTSQVAMDDCLFLCSRPSFSMKDAANRACKNTGSQPAVLKISMEGIDKSKILPCHKIYKENMSLNDSLAISPNLRYYGTIDPKYISIEDITKHYLHPRILFEHMREYELLMKKNQDSKANKDPNLAKTEESMQGK